MAYNTISELFKGICDALRNKTGATGLINHQDIPARINGIVASGTGVDTSNTTATEDVILQDYTAYSKNELITGNLPYVENGKSRRYYDDGVTLTTSSADAAYARVTNDYAINSPRAFLYGSKLHIDVPFSDFGDAEKKHVLAGQTFTSFEGLLQVGEYVPTSADGSGVDTTITTNGATASDILKNKKAWVNNTLITGTHECTGGIDTSNATVTAEDMAEGIIAYGADGKEVIGNVKTYDTQVGWNNRVPNESNNLLNLSISTNTPYLFRKGFFLTTPLTNLGDATENQVLDTATFTSSAGLMKTGKIATINGASPSISIDSSGVITSSVEYRKGYIGTEETLSTTQQLNTKSATTYTPSESDQTIASGTYLTGVQTIKGDPNLIPENIKSGVTIFNVLGSNTGGSSLVTKKGTTTSTTINTGLKKIDTIYIGVQGVASGNGLRQFIGSEDLGYCAVTGYNQYSTSTTTDITASYATIDGGSITWKPTSGAYAFNSNTTYNWLAIGTE